MQDTRALLELIYKNAEMGKITIPQLIELSRDEKFIASLREQLTDYEALSAEASRMIHDLYGEASTSFEITAGERVDAVNRAYMEITSNNLAYPMMIPITFIG